MAAYICLKPKGSCAKCGHYRYDEDYGAKACFAQQDKTPDVDHITRTIYDTPIENPKEN